MMAAFLISLLIIIGLAIGNLVLLAKCLAESRACSAAEAAAKAAAGSGQGAAGSPPEWRSSKVG
jgi:hypothetical protein